MRTEDAVFPLDLSLPSTSEITHDADLSMEEQMEDGTTTFFDSSEYSESTEGSFSECPHSEESGKNYVLRWKFYSYKSGKDVNAVKPTVVDCFGVVRDAKTNSRHVVRSEKAVIPMLNHLKIAMVKMSKQMDWSERFDPQINYESRIPARMSIFDVLMHHVPTGDFKELTSKCQIFCKTGVLQGIGERLYWKRELKLNACYVDGAVFIQIDMDFAMSDVKTRSEETPNLNKSSYLGRQFPAEITQEVVLPSGAKFTEFRTVVHTEFPSHTVLTTGEIDAIDEEEQLIEIKCLKGGFDNRFWKERSCKLFLQMFFSGSRRCLQGHTSRDEVIDIREIDLNRIAEKGANLPERLFPWYKEDVMRFIDDFLSSAYKELAKSPKVVFDITKEEGHSRFRIDPSPATVHDFFPVDFLMHFHIDLH